MAARGLFCFLLFVFFSGGGCGRAVFVLMNEKMRSVGGRRFVIVCSFIPILAKGFWNQGLGL